jgi:thiamine biosynthesis protein ThiS
VRLRLNGKDYEAKDGISVAELLQRLHLDTETRVAVAVNGEIAPRTARDRRLEEGDRVEVIRPVAGG